MANDRLFLVCKDCGRGIMLYKYFPSHGYSPTGIEQRLDDFMARHLWEDHEGGTSQLPDRFTLKTEIDMTQEEWDSLWDPMKP